MQSGYLLRNRYRIQNPLSAGGFGETYIAIDEDYPNKRQVVVKHLKPQSNDPVVLEMARRLFNTEAITLANLGEKTDRIPTLYAYFEEDQDFYLVQELIEGPTLAQELGTDKLSEAETLKVVQEILAILSEVHSRQIVHRDLKPDNIIRRSRDEQLVLIDFGAVKAVRETNLIAPSATRSVGIGTSGYMPTEQAMGFPTAASDVYAVGAIALQCLTGTLPNKLFDEDALELRWQHLCSVSEPVAHVLSKMVASKQLDRYANATEAISAINPLLTSSRPAQITPTVISSPVNPQSPSQSAPAASGNMQALQRLKADDKSGLIAWVLLGCSGVIFGTLFLGLILSFLFNAFKTPSTPPIDTTQTTPSATTGTEQNSDQEDNQAKLTSYNQTIADNQNNAVAWNDRGLLKYQKLQDYQGALVDYNKAIKLNPNLVNAYINRGLLKHKKLQDYQGALADNNKAIQLDPNNADAYNNRGLLKTEQLQDHQGALSDYNRSIEFDTGDAISYHNRALLKDERLQDYQGALADYNQAIKLDQNYAVAYHNRGNFKDNKLQDYQGALADYNQAIKLDSNYAIAYNNRGLLKHQRLQDISGALADYNQAIKIDSNYAIAYYNRGSIKDQKRQDYQGALADYNQAIKLDPSYANTYNNRSLIKFNQLNDLNGGISDMKQAAKLYKQQGSQKDYQDSITQLQQWGEK
jgi:serine/threonine protein kinase/lipoprotein NlpI